MLQITDTAIDNHGKRNQPLEPRKSQSKWRGKGTGQYSSNENVVLGVVRAFWFVYYFEISLGRLIHFAKQRNIYSNQKKKKIKEKDMRSASKQYEYCVKIERITAQYEYS